MNKRILIAGCGDIGTRLGWLLVKMGHRVWGMRRNAEQLPDEFTPIAADLSQPLDPSVLPPELSTVYFTTAASERSDSGYQSAYVRGVENLIEALGTQPEMKRFIFVSSTSVYAQIGGVWVDEASPTEPSHFTGKRILEAETIVSQSPWSSSCVRFGGIYGPGRERLLKSVQSGNAKLKAPEGEDTPFYTNRIHQDDCAGILAHLLENTTLPAILLGVDNNPAPYNSVIEWMAKECGTPLSTEPHSNPGTTNKRCKDIQLKELGYELLYPSFRHGYQPLIDQSIKGSTPTE